MTDRFFKIVSVIKAIKDNSRNNIYVGGESPKKIIFSDFYADIQRAAEWLCSKISHEKSIIILGWDSYSKIVVDLACIRSGIKTIFLPSNLPMHSVDAIYSSNDCVLILSDQVYGGKLNTVPLDFYRKEKFNSSYKFRDLAVSNGIYTACLSSGTTSKSHGDILNIPYFSFEDRGTDHYDLAPNQKLFVWMSLSHFIQRVHIFEAFALEMDLVISNKDFVVTDLIRYQPAHMVSAPYLYDDLLVRIEHEIREAGRLTTALLKISRIAPDWRFISLLRSRLLYKFFVSRIPTLAAFRNAKNFFWNGGRLALNTAQQYAALGVRIYGAYGLSELGPISSDCAKTYMPGSVGVPSREVLIDENGKILVKNDSYVRQLDGLKLQGDFIATGDLGEFRSGRLYVLGRIDDILVMRNGRKINPHPVEGAMKNILGLEHLMLTSIDLNSLVLVLDKSVAIEKIRHVVSVYNRSVRPYAKIKFLIFIEHFEWSGGYYTENFKMRRRKINAEAVKAWGESRFFAV